MTTAIRLGQRAYFVGADGVVPTLVSSIALLGSRRGGKTTFGTLAGRERVYVDFDKTYAAALERLNRLAEATDVTVKEQQKYAADYKYCREHKLAIQKRVVSVDRFPQYDHCYSPPKNPRYFRQSDFPKSHLDLGVEVWAIRANTHDGWHIIHGWITGVEFHLDSKKITYGVGAGRFFAVDAVFCDKNTALDALAKAFREALPGTLDRKRVQVIQAITEKEERARNHATAIREFRRYSKMWPHGLHD